MAAAAIKALELKNIGEMKKLPENTALDGSLGGLLPWPYKDERGALLVENTSTTATLKITKGDTFMGAAADMSYSVPAGTSVVNINSAPYIHTKGDKKGCIELLGPATLKIGAIVLP